MDLHLHEISDAHIYKSRGQRARVITEHWTKMNLYCPVCGAPHLVQFEANRPVADFYCERCGAQFEQKSLHRKPPRHLTKINGSSYSAMAERLSSNNNPHLLLMYRSDDNVDNLILVPKHFFTNSIIAPRKSTKPKGRSKPWVGSYILLNEVPESGIIYIVKNGVEENQSKVLDLYRKTLPLITGDLESQGWLLDVLKCVEKIPTSPFSLSQVYAFEPELKKKHPGNHHIKDKIRQQLQVLRDKGFIDFVGRGIYNKNF